MPTLTAIDVIGIQSYIFASNRLRDVIAASHLVEWATNAKEQGGLALVNHSAFDEVVAAGGNAILQFVNQDAAKQFARHYTKELLRRAPGLDVTIAHDDYEPGQLARGLLKVQIRLAEAKLQRRPHAPQLGLSVMQPCAVTGLPASTRRHEDGSWVSPRIARLRSDEVRNEVHSKWQRFLPSSNQLPSALKQYSVCFPDEFDQMGRSHGDTSLIGVVHIDGDAVGQRIQRWLLKHAKTETDDETVRQQYRRWSKALVQLGETVVQHLVRRVTERLESRREGIFVAGQSGPRSELDFPLMVYDNLINLPLRPILLGGDDLTFVCDGRIALDLATAALEVFHSESKGLDDLKLLGEDPMTACAGIALVKAHTPFDHAYRLCEELCANAKAAKKKLELSSRTSSCWIDWHVGSIRLGKSVMDIRNRQYQRDMLTCRPYALKVNARTQLSWQWLDRELLGPPFGDHGKASFRNPAAWGERRNKVKALASLVRDGRDAIRSQVEAWQVVEPELKLPEPISYDGFFSSARTPLLDAIELLDLHLRLDAPNAATTPDVKLQEAPV